MRNAFIVEMGGGKVMKRMVILWLVYIHTHIQIRFFHNTTHSRRYMACLILYSGLNTIGHMSAPFFLCLIIALLYIAQTLALLD